MNVSRKDKMRKRHLRVRQRIAGTGERPRLCVVKSLRHMYVQILDDTQGRTLCAATTNRKDLKADGRHSFCNKEYARRLGVEIAKKALDNGIQRVVFDRGGYNYHGCVRELAEAAREGGLSF